MSRVEAAAADRLPWLPDEPERKPKRGHGLLRWFIAPVLLAAAGGFWFGVRSVHTVAPSHKQQAAPSTTIRVPPARVRQAPQVHIPAQPQVQPLPAREVRPSLVRELHISPPRVSKNAPDRTYGPTSETPELPQHVAPAPVAVPLFVAPTPWNPRVFEGANGRIVEIGAFGSTHQAKVGWRYMVRAYPAVAHLPAVVRPSQNSKGRAFYRFQIGTTSQAHSEILCQRMRRITLSCAVVGLPWKAKVER